MRGLVVKSPVGVFSASRPRFSSPPAFRLGVGGRSRAAKPAQPTLDPPTTPNPTQQATEFPFSFTDLELAERGRSSTLPPASIRAGLSPGTLCHIRFERFKQACWNGPIYNIGALRPPSLGSGALRQFGILDRNPFDYAVFKRAPSGTTPVSRKRHSDTKSLRAKATIPTRRERRLPGPYRSRNHKLSWLVG